MLPEIWYLPSKVNEGTVVFNAHNRGACAGRACALHAPSDHWARELELVWNSPEGLSTRGWMGRRCEHGNVHDDPDDLAFRRSQTNFTVIRASRCACDCCGSQCDWGHPF